MRVSWTIGGLLLAIALVNCSPIAEREAENELSPLNEVYVVETDEAADDERGDRDKRKIGIVKLGVSNGIINFVFGKLDAFLDAKIHALESLDESNKAKNAAFGIDNTKSATSQFISDLIHQKIQASTGSIGPIINSAGTFISTAAHGLSGAFASKFAPLSSLSGVVSGGDAGGHGAGHDISGGGGGGGGSSSGILGSILSQKLGSLSSLSGGLSGGQAAGGASSDSSSGSEASVGAGINLGAFANHGGGATPSTTTEDVPEFDRKKVSLDIPPPVFGSGFTLITNVSKVISSVILNSAHRTEKLLEIFKPFFRGIFAIKGLPSDNPK